MDPSLNVNLNVLLSFDRIIWHVLPLQGRASIYILRTTFGIDWSERVRIIYVGDDDTDEDAIRALKG